MLNKVLELSVQSDDIPDFIFCYEDSRTFENILEHLKNIRGYSRSFPEYSRFQIWGKFQN